MLVRSVNRAELQNQLNARHAALACRSLLVAFTAAHVGTKETSMRKHLLLTITPPASPPRLVMTLNARYTQANNIQKSQTPPLLYLPVKE